MGALDGVDILGSDPTWVERLVAAFRSSLAGGHSIAADIPVVVEDNIQAVDSSRVGLAGLDRTLVGAVAIGRCWDPLQAVVQLQYERLAGAGHCFHYHNSTSCTRSSRQRTSDIDKDIPLDLKRWRIFLTDFVRLINFLKDFFCSLCKLP